MEVVIIDDEKRARSLLRTILEQECSGIESIYEAPNLLEGVALIQAHQPKLVFLDIEMPEHQGIEIFEHFAKEEINFEIVFCTAFSEYALRAFEMNAIDYLLKPLRPQKVKGVVEKVQSSFRQDQIQEKLEELKNALRLNKFQKIGLPVSNGILFIPIEEIILMEADGMYTKVFTTNNGSELVSKPLKFFNDLMEKSPLFYRPHRSFIMNIKFVKQYVRTDGNYVVLENDYMVPISKDKKEEFLNLVSSI